MKHFRFLLYASPMLFCCLLALGGCALVEIEEQTRIADNTGVITGKIKPPEKQTGNIIVGLYRNEKGFFILENHMMATPEGGYLFHLTPDTYYIAAFVDSNNDGKYQPDEYASYYGKPTAVKVGAKQTVTLPVLYIKGKLAINHKYKSIDNTPLAVKNIGRVVSMHTPLFNEDNESMGLWKPVDFLEKIGGGLFLLQQYQDNRIPVLFIHGANGGANDWMKIVEKLDRTRFQPFLFYYPSGLRLDMVSDFLTRSVSQLQNSYGFRQLFIIAHSMGGLVARSFVMKYRKRYPHAAKSIHLLVTINTPMKGMHSAANGVRNSPIVVPSWRDVATGSSFLQKLNAWQWPGEIPYYLVFSYESGKGGDGVVTLQSQIPLKLQSEAVRIYGFNASHAGILEKNVFIAKLNEILLANFQRPK